MSLVDTTLAEIANSLELPSLSFNEKGVVALSWGDTDLISLERRDNGVLLNLVRPLSQHRQGQAEKALRLCGTAGGLPFPTRAGLTKDNKLVFSVFFTEQHFILNEVLHCLNSLRDAHNAVTHV